MKIICEEHYKKVLLYAKEIGDTTLQNCLDRLKKWENNPRNPCEIELYYDRDPYSFYFKQRLPDGNIAIEGGIIYHGTPDRSSSFTLNPANGWQIHT